MRVSSEIGLVHDLYIAGDHCENPFEHFRMNRLANGIAGSTMELTADLEIVSIPRKKTPQPKKHQLDFLL